MCSLISVNQTQMGTLTFFHFELIIIHWYSYHKEVIKCHLVILETRRIWQLTHLTAHSLRVQST